MPAYDLISVLLESSIMVLVSYFYLRSKPPPPIDTRGYGLIFTFDQQRDNYRRKQNYVRRCKKAYNVAWSKFSDTIKKYGYRRTIGTWENRTVDDLFHSYLQRYERGTEFIKQLRRNECNCTPRKKYKHWSKRSATTSPRTRKLLKRSAALNRS